MIQTGNGNSHYLGVETRQDLLRLEKAWYRSNYLAVKYLGVSYVLQLGLILQHGHFCQNNYYIHPMVCFLGLEIVNVFVASRFDIFSCDILCIFHLKIWHIFYLYYCYAVCDIGLYGTTLKSDRIELSMNKGLFHISNDLASSVFMTEG